VLQIESKVSYSFYTLNEYQHSMNFNFLRASTPNAIYADQAEIILKLTCSLSNPGNGRKLRIDVFPGNTELFIDIVDEETGVSTRAKLDGSMQDMDVKGAHLVFVLDVSKSMEKDDIQPDDKSYPPNRMGAVIEAFYGTIESMKANDSLNNNIVSLVTLSGTSRTILRRIPVREVPSYQELAIEHHRGTRYVNTLKKIQANILLENGEADDTKPTVVFLSDGGDTGDDFNDVLNEMKVSYPGLIIHSVSFGRNKNATRLQLMAEIGSGFFFTCKSSKQLIEAFETVQCLNYNFSVEEEANDPSAPKIKYRKDKEPKEKRVSSSKKKKE